MQLLNSFCMYSCPHTCYVQAMSWLDGYECYGTQDIDKLAGSSDPTHPLLILLAHDGDNAFGGGYSYYEQCVKNFVDEGRGKVRSGGVVWVCVYRETANS